MKEKQRSMYTGIEYISPNSHPHPKSTLRGYGEKWKWLWFMTNHGCLKLTMKKNSNSEIPGRTGPKTKAHVALGGQRIIAQFLKVLWPKILVSVPCHGIFTCGCTKQAQIRSFPLENVSVVEKPAPLVISKSPIFSYSSFPIPLDNICNCCVAGKV